MNNFKAAIVQHRSLDIEYIEKNTICAINFINEAKANGADFVLFPECFSTSYYVPPVCKTLKPLVEIENNSDLNKIAMPQPWQAIAQRFCSI